MVVSAQRVQNFAERGVPAQRPVNFVETSKGGFSNEIAGYTSHVPVGGSSVGSIRCWKSETLLIFNPGV